MKFTKFALAIAAMTLTAGAMAAEANITPSAPAINACAKGALRAMPRSFEEVDNEQVLAALHTKPAKGGCWERLGDKGADGYATGNIKVLKAGAEQVPDIGSVLRYDVMVAGEKVGAATRYVTTETPTALNRDGKVVRSGMLSKLHPNATEVEFPTGERLVIDDIVIVVGYTAPVLVDFNGGRKTYSVSKYDRGELETIGRALVRLDEKERQAVQSALSLSFE
jgi:hypothetical protein